MILGVVAGQMRRAGVAWSPSSLSPYAWYDADNSASLTLVSGEISQWNDISGNSRHLLTGSSTTRPTLITDGQANRDVARFDGTKWVQSNAASSVWTFLHDGTLQSVFIAAKGKTQYGHFLSTKGSAGSSVGALLGYSFANTSLEHHIHRGVGGGDVVTNLAAAASMPVDTFAIGGINADPSNATAAARSAIRMTGGAASSNNTTTATPATGSPVTTLQVGSRGSAPSLIGDIGEIVIISGAVSVDNRQRMEGYLAHKWGVESLLPSDHPYKDAPPLA